MKNQEEMFKALLENKKIRHTGWETVGCVYLSGGMIINDDGEPFNMSFSQPEKWEIYREPSTAYYKWRLWHSDGDITEPDTFVDESGTYGDGIVSLIWKCAVKREKISEAVYKCEGQE